MSQFKRYKPREGHPDWKQMFQRADDLAKHALKTIEIDGGSLSEMGSEARRIAAALATTGQSILTNRRRLARGDETLLPPYFIWTMLNACNYRCGYCDNHSGQKYFDLSNKGALDTGQGKRLLQIARKNVSGIYFCGGEPTLRNDLAELTDFAHGLGYFPLMINTNGSQIHKMLTDPRYSRWLKQMDIVIVSLDALNVPSLSEVWGVKAAECEQTIVNILALRRLQRKVRFKLMVNTVITPETIDEADAILDWSNDLGIWYSPVPMNRGATVDGKFSFDPKYLDLCAKILRRKKKGRKILGSRRLLSDLLYSKPIRCRPSLKPHVDIDGSLIWPCKTKCEVEPLRINLLDYESFDAAYRAGAAQIDPTNFHGHGPGQCGADCGWMQNYVTAAYARGLENPLSSGLLAELTEFAGIA